MQTPKLLLHAQSGPYVGTKSIRRTLSLARAWKQGGGEVHFVGGAIPSRLFSKIRGEGFSFYRQRAGSDTSTPSSVVQTIVQTANRIKPDWIVIDDPRVDPVKIETYLSQHSRILEVRPSGIVNFHPNTHASSSSSGDVVAGDTVDFGLVLTIEKGSSKPPRIYRQAKRILIDFSGTNPDVWSFPTLQTLAEIDRGQLVVDCLLGPNAVDANRIEQLKQKSESHIRLHRNVDRLLPLIQHIDMAVTSAGATSLELARNGIPGIVIASDSQQKQLAEQLHARQVLHHLFEWTQDSSEAFLDQPSSFSDSLSRIVKQFLNDRELRIKLSQNGHQLVDGHGAERLARRMQVEIRQPLQKSA